MTRVAVSRRAGRGQAALKEMFGTESSAELVLLNRIQRWNLPRPELQARLIPGRLYRFDFAWLEPYRVAVEVQGGVYTGGRHTTGAGFEKDAEKLAEAQILGFLTLYVTPTMIRSGLAIDLIVRALKARGWRKECPT